MRYPKRGEVWTLKGNLDPRHVRHVPVLILDAVLDAPTCILTTSPAERSSSGWAPRVTHTLEAFLELYKRAPEGTPDPIVWPPVARPEPGASFARLGDVPVGWLFRDGWEEPGEWNVRKDDDRSYEGALVECRPPLERPTRPTRKAPK